MAEKPLTGKRILITRARAQASSLAEQIESLGGTVVECPTIEILPPSDHVAFDAAVANIDGYSWLIITSVNSIDPLLSRLAKAGKSVADLSHLKIAAIGPETAKRLELAGLSVDIVPARYQAEGILESLDAAVLRGKSILIPRAAKARDLLPQTLRQWGAKVDVVEAYRTVLPNFDAADIKRKLQRGEIDFITFTSSSTVAHFAQLFGHARISQILGSAAIVSIGPITASTVEEFGGRVTVLAKQFTIDGLINALIEYVSRDPGSAHRNVAIKN